MVEALVLGATGFIGGHIARAALKENWTVRGFRRRPQSTGHLQRKDIHWVDGNLEDFSSLEKAMQGADYVFHAAAYYPTGKEKQSLTDHLASAKMEINNVLTAAHTGRIRRLIYTSSLSTIGLPPPDADRLADERDHYQPGTFPDNAYYEVKSIMERAVIKAAQKGLDAVVLNPTAVFGPGDVHLTTGRILVAAARGQVLAAPEGTINTVDVRDVAACHITAAQRGKSGERYILGGENYPIKEALTIAANIAHAHPPLVKIPGWVLNLAVQLDKALPLPAILPDHVQGHSHWQGYNTQKAKRALGLSPRPFEETVRDSLRWYRDHGVL